MTRTPRTLAAAALTLTALALAVPAGAHAAGTQRAYVTGYSWWDNDPPGSADIAHPVRHPHAAGTGTYSDPVTVAVGATDGAPNLPFGTVVYLPWLMRYGVVEDTCAACNGLWLDWWVDGRGDTPGQADACMAKITGRHAVIVAAGPGYRVRSGPIAAGGGCAKTFDEKARRA